MRKGLLGVSLVAIMMMVGGCKQVQPFGGIPRKKVVTSAASLSPSTTELIALLGIKIVGRCKADNYPVSVSDAAIVADLKPNYEALARLKPDVIVLDKALYSDAEIQKVKAVSANTDVIVFDPHTLEDFYKEMYKMANIVGGEIPVAEYIQKIKKQQLSSLGEQLPPTKAVLVIPDKSGYHMFVGAKSFQADLIKSMGATPIGPNSDKFETLNPEFLMSQNPDVIIVAGDLNTFTADKRFASLKAVKEQRMFGLPQDIILRRGCRVDSCIYEGHKALALVTKGK